MAAHQCWNEIIAIFLFFSWEKEPPQKEKRETNFIKLKPTEN